MDTRTEPDRLPAFPRTAILILLAIGPDDRHGYAILQEVDRITDGTTKLGPGGLYTTIRRLLDDGLIEESDVRPDPSVDDARRRYYRLTAVGRSVVAAEVRKMQALVAAARPWAIGPET